MHNYVALTLRGDHYTMGRQHGRQVKQLRPHIVEAIEARFRQIERDGPDARFEALLRETREVLETLDAPLLDMIRGQAEALEFEFDTLLRYDLVAYLRDALTTRHRNGASGELVRHRNGASGELARKAVDGEGCTTWAATGSATANGQPMLVKNRDYRLEHLPLQIVVRATPGSGYRYVYSGSAGSPGVFCGGINQAGLAIADTHVSSTDVGPGLPDYALMMHILESYGDVSSALDYVRSVPRLGRNNLIMADARGHLAVFEIGHRTCGALETHEGTLVNTNHFASPGLQTCFVDTNPPQTEGNSFHRYEKVTNELRAARGRIDVRFAQRLMATHEGPLASICRHPRAGSAPSEWPSEDDGESATVSTSIFLPALRKMLFCHGLPCRGHYDDFVL